MLCRVWFILPPSNAKVSDGWPHRNSRTGNNHAGPAIRSTESWQSTACDKTGLLQCLLAECEDAQVCQGGSLLDRGLSFPLKRNDPNGFPIPIHLMSRDRKHRMALVLLGFAQSLQQLL